MAVDWRRLFSSIGVEWIDRGPNTSRGNINIRCPWCGEADPSYHLSIAEDDIAYFCYRDPRSHRGRDAVRLLVELGYKRSDAIELFNAYAIDRPIEKAPPPRPAVARLLQRWERFHPASENDDIDYYLRQRGFRNVPALCDRYDLRWTPRGRFARRVLFPLHDADGWASWTGRTIDPDRQPRYETQPADTEAFVYVPRMPRAVCYLVEGPMDALKVSVATERLGVSAIGLLGLNVNASKIEVLRRITNECRLLLLVLDANVRVSFWQPFVNDLHVYIGKPIRRVTVPQGYADPGELSYEGVVKWTERNLQTRT